jgi:hypothetical protein
MADRQFVPRGVSQLTAKIYQHSEFANDAVSKQSLICDQLNTFVQGD